MVVLDFDVLGYVSYCSVSGWFISCGHITYILVGLLSAHVKPSLVISGRSRLCDIYEVLHIILAFPRYVRQLSIREMW